MLIVFVRVWHTLDARLHSITTLLGCGGFWNNCKRRLNNIIIFEETSNILQVRATFCVPNDISWCSQTKLFIPCTVVCQGVSGVKDTYCEAGHCYTICYTIHYRLPTVHSRNTPYQFAQWTSRVCFHNNLPQEHIQNTCITRSCSRKKHRKSLHQNIV